MSAPRFTHSEARELLDALLLHLQMAGFGPLAERIEAFLEPGKSTGDIDDLAQLLREVVLAADRRRAARAKAAR